MNLEGLASAGPAQRSLARLLRTAYADERRATHSLKQALETAHRTTLPDDSTELLEFARMHLVPQMGDVGANLIAAMLEDLEAEIEHERARNDPFSSSRIALSTRMPPPHADGPGSEMRVPTARPPSFDDLTKTAENAAAPQPMSPFDMPTSEIEIPKALRTAGPPPTKRAHREGITRPAVVLVDADRFARASLARALVQGRCDVTVLEGLADLLPVIEGTEPVDVLITDVDGAEIDGILQAMQRVRPEVPVLAWTKSARPVAEHVLAIADVGAFEVLGKTCRSAEVVDAVKRLAGME